MDTTLLHELAAQMRTEADLFARRGLEREAAMAKSYASDLEAKIHEWELEELSLEAAAKESGFAYDSLQKRVSRGEIPNAGDKGSPRVMRCDLPYKGGRRGPKLVGEEGSGLADEILARKMS